MAFVKLIRKGTVLSQASKSYLRTSLNVTSSHCCCSKVSERASARSFHLTENVHAPPYLIQKRGVSVQQTPIHVPGSVFQHAENLNAVRLLKSLPVYKNLLFQSDGLADESHLQVQLSQEASSQGKVVKVDSGWRDSVVAFIESAYTSHEAKLPVTHPKNQEAVGNLLKEIAQVTDDELCQILYHMRFFAPCPSGKDPSYMSIWKQLDKECQVRRPTWSLDFSFVVADLWYGMNLARHSEFHWSLIKKLFRKCDKLSKEHFVRFLFCLNINRDIPDNINTYDLEYSLNKICHLLTPEEVVIIGMAFFKTQTPLRDPNLLKRLLIIFMKNSESMDSVSVSAISKLTRYSADYKSSQIVQEFQDKFIPEIPRLSITACTHLTLTGTNCLSPNKELIQLVTNRIQEDITEARLKELERVCLSMTMFNADCDQLAKLIAEELQRPERADEIRKYGRCLPALLHYLSIRNIFIPDLISMCLSKAFRDTYYGSGKEIFQRELLCLDVLADLEIENYTGKRLEAKTSNFIMKKNMLRIRPPHKVKVPAYDQFLREVTFAVKTIMTNDNFFHVCAILPHHHTMALVYCRDQDGKLVQIPQYLKDIESHHIKKLQIESAITYHALILCGRNMYLYNTYELSGQATLQLRQIQKLGYKTKLVYYCDWERQGDTNEKTEHIKKIVIDC